MSHLFHRWRTVLIVRHCECPWLKTPEGAEIRVERMLHWDTRIGPLCHAMHYEECRCGLRRHRAVTQRQPVVDPWKDEGILPARKVLDTP